MILIHHGEKQTQYFANVSLKVNIKFGGINHKLDANDMKWLTKSNTMLVGIEEGSFSFYEREVIYMYQAAG